MTLRQLHNLAGCLTDRGRFGATGNRNWEGVWGVITSRPMWGLPCNWVRLRQQAVPLLIFLCTSVEGELSVFTDGIYCECLVAKGLALDSQNLNIALTFQLTDLCDVNQQNAHNFKLIF